MDSREEQMPILCSKDTSPSFQESRIEEDEERGTGDDGIKVYCWRWVVLIVFVANLAVTNTIWITFAPIADVVRCYYHVSDFWVNSLSTVYMATYILFIIPSVWLLNRFGLRTTSVIAACFSAAGACLRVAGVGENNIHIM